MKYFAAACFLLLLLPLIVLARQTPLIFLENHTIRLAVDVSHAPEIVELSLKHPPRHLLQRGAIPRPMLAGAPWSDNAVTTVSRWDTDENSSIVRLSVRYPRATANITLSCPKNGSEISLKLDASSDEPVIVEEIEFPILPAMSGLGKSPHDDMLIRAKRSYGVLTKDPFREAMPEELLRYPEDGMQLAGIYDPTGGFYLRSEDRELQPKRFVFSGQGSRSLSIQHLFPAVARQNFSLSFPVTVGVIRGDWFDMAKRYKRWAREQPWFKTPNPRKDTFLSRALPIVHAYNHFFDEQKLSLVDLSQAAKHWSEKLESTIALLLHGWEHFGNFLPPYYLPPKEGWPAFDALQRTITSNSNELFLYLAVSSWASKGKDADLISTLFNRYGRAAAIADGSSDPYPYEMLETTGYTKIRVCPSSQLYRTQMLENAKALLDHGVAAMQFDEFPQGVFYPCYAKEHSHIPGYGTWLFRDNLAFAEEFRDLARANGKEIALTAEEMSEAFLPYFDGYVSRDNAPDFNKQTAIMDPSSETIPLFAAVYHEVRPSFGQFDNSAYGMARGFVRGKLAHISAMTPVNDKDLQLLQRIIRAQQGYAKDFILRGTMLRPPGTSVYRTTQYGSRFAATDPMTTPFLGATLHTGAWQVGEKRAIFAVNNGEKPVNFVFRHKDYCSRNDPRQMLLNNLALPHNCPSDERLCTVAVPAKSLLALICGR